MRLLENIMPVGKDVEVNFMAMAPCHRHRGDKASEKNARACLVSVLRKSDALKKAPRRRTSIDRQEEEARQGGSLEDERTRTGTGT